MLVPRYRQTHTLTCHVLLASMLIQAAVGESVQEQLEDRLKGALWGLFIGDALAMPVHWYYGGPQQIKRDFGGPLTGYEKSKWPFPESIMQLSSTGGAGRGGSEGDIIGSVILQGKKEYWARGGQYHYHHTLQPGENTLEAALVRVFLRGVASSGQLAGSPTRFRQDYISFMTTPGTHNDTYASTCHRMFFANYNQGVAAEKCPDNDHHNVDTMDGLVIPAAVAIAALAAGLPHQEVSALAGQVLAVTRQSSELAPYVDAVVEMLGVLVSGETLPRAAAAVTQSRYGSDIQVAVDQRGGSDPMVACYIGGGYPALLHFAYKYGADPREVLLSSANAGGENVHRGAVLGALTGAAFGFSGLPQDLLEGLVHRQELEEEIRQFAAVVLKQRPQASGEL